MKHIATILLKIFILCILPMLATINDIDSWQAKIEDLLATKDSLLNLAFSEDRKKNSNVSESRNIVHTNTSEGYVGDFADLEDDCNQTVEHTVNMPEIKTEKRKRSSEVIQENIQSQPPVKHRKREQDIQATYSEVALFNHIAEFNHRSSSHFLFSKNNFKIEKYRSIFKFNGSIFIEEFCSKEQFQNTNPDIFTNQTNFEKLEVYAKRVVTEYVELSKPVSNNFNELCGNSYASLNKALDPARTKGFYYLLIYSLYETGLIGVPRYMNAVEKIFINIIAYTRLMAYMHNYKVKDEMTSKKLKSSRCVRSKTSKSEQSSYHRSNFSYTDFTKGLRGRSFRKHDLFRKNADLLRKEINDNIQLIIDKEFRLDPEYKQLCEDYNSKALEFNKKILFERFFFKIGKHVADNYLYEDLDFDSFIYVNGFPKNILSYLMDTDTKKQIKDLTDIRLKSVFILIFISKICLCNVTHLCTLPEYLILIGSLQEAYIKHKTGQDKTIDNFQSLLSYFFSLHYLDIDQEEDKRERAKKVIKNVFPECKEIFPNFKSEIYNLARA